MRRVLSIALLVGLLPAGVLAADGTAMLGANGELYRVQSGTHGSLFENPPAGASDNAVLALDIVRDGATQRLLVPGTEGPELEQSPALTVDRATNRVFLVWEAQRTTFPLAVLGLLTYSEEGWGDVLEFAADPFSAKSNPQLATTLDHYETFGPDDEVVEATQTILHLAWYDEGGQGQRVLYSPLVVEGGEVLQGNRVLDLEQLAAGVPGVGVPNDAALAALREKPQVRGGRDGQSVVVAFVAPERGELVSLELRSVTGELVAFADKARAQVIEIGNRNPGLSRPAIADKARAQVIEIGRRLLRPEAADFLAKRLVDAVGGSTPEEPFEDVVDAARAQVIEIGAALRRGVADKASAQVIEIGHSGGVAGTTHLLDVRKSGRRGLPLLPDQPVRVLLSQRGDDAALAWLADGTVRYRESTGDGGWGPVRVLTLGPGLDSDDAYDLVARRLADR